MYYCLSNLFIRTCPGEQIFMYENVHGMIIFMCENVHAMAIYICENVHAMTIFMCENVHDLYENIHVCMVVPVVTIFMY